MESPLYVVRQESNRMTFPEVFKLILLAGTMYFGIFINFMILRKQMTVVHHAVIIAVLLALVILQSRISRIRSKNISYMFYQNRIEQQGDEPMMIYLGNVSMVYLKKSLADRIFGTGTIYLEPGFAIRGVKHPDEIHQYVQRLVQLARQSASFASPQTFKE